MTRFLFLRGLESFSASMYKANSSGPFARFKMGTCGLEVYHLQYANDNVLLGSRLWIIY